MVAHGWQAGLHIVEGLGELVCVPCWLGGTGNSGTIWRRDLDAETTPLGPPCRSSNPELHKGCGSTLDGLTPAIGRANCEVQPWALALGAGLSPGLELLTAQVGKPRGVVVSECEPRWWQ